MKKKYRYALLITIITPVLMVLLSNLIIEFSADGKTYNDIDSVPKNKVGLVLGTSKKLSSGHANPYYANRINATIALYKAGKIDFVLVSGDNGSKYYNEPTTFKKDLVSGGIPGEKIFLDYAGFRTLDSMVRAKVIFGLDSVTVISQKFHNKRAIFIAGKKGLTAIGFNAVDVKGQQGRKVKFREYLARVKVFVDLVLNTQPKFFGEKVVIE
ncbi:vancomycin high temperature exclusion protein [Muriicola sp. Z0-33]|uniref:SanA/YdcF family protein n=1 Tax=Muriicola sp. Z0-33 TaxID=2816957 RepID=UPI002237BD2B|nr:ElyC/SanA/YdcF family protein [Muriicola sp. Z0-33]MCW5516198.1 YdcF family protein [Muriicola sp. Z0-33]